MGHLAVADQMVQEGIAKRLVCPHWEFAPGVLDLVAQSLGSKDASSIRSVISSQAEQLVRNPPCLKCTLEMIEPQCGFLRLLRCGVWCLQGTERLLYLLHRWPRIRFLPYVMREW